ncbi:MAG: hypothetical protein ACKO3G_13540 [Planctomycetaceae bacterium]
MAPSLPRVRRRCVAPAARLTAALVAAACLAAAPAAAAPLISGLHRTGEPAPAAAAARGPVDMHAAAADPCWSVVALPEQGAILPFAAAVDSGRCDGFYVPRVWYHGRSGIGDAGWIGPRAATTDSLYPPITGPAADYTVIYATTFTASQAGMASFDLAATADNAVAFFVNGTVAGGDTLTPWISGGAAIGTEQRHLNRLHAFRGLAPVVAGENTLYAVVRDRYVINSFTGIGGHGQTGLFVASVPEPSTLGAAAAAVATLALFRLRPVPAARRRVPARGERVTPADGGG